MTHPWDTVLSVTLSLLAFLLIQYALRLWAKYRRHQAVKYVESIQELVLNEVRSPARLEALKGVRGAAARQQEYLDGICRSAAQTLGVPASVMTVVEANGQGTIATWSPDGCPMEVGLEASFCKYVVAFRKPLVVEDATKDQLVMTNEASRQAEKEGIVSYLGVPLYTDDSEQHVIGTLCVFDKEQPRKWDDKDMLALEALADLVDLSDDDMEFTRA